MPTILFLLIFCTLGVWYERGWVMALSYAGLFVGMMLAAVFLRTAWELYRYPRNRGPL